MTPSLPICSSSNQSFELNYCPDEGAVGSPQSGDSSRADIPASRVGTVPPSSATSDSSAVRQGISRIIRGTDAESPPTTSPRTSADLSAPTTRAALSKVREGLASATQSLASSSEGSGDLATMSLMQAHDALQGLIADPTVGDHPVVQRLQQRYFSALEALPAEVRARAGEDVMSSLDHFEVQHADGGSTEIYSDHRIDVDAPSMIIIEDPIELDVPEGAHVTPGSTMTCERVGDTTVEEGADGVVITTEPGVICTVTPPPSSVQ